MLNQFDLVTLWGVNKSDDATIATAVRSVADKNIDLFQMGLKFIPIRYLKRQVGQVRLHPHRAAAG